MRRFSEGVYWALLFSVPVGVGVSLATARVSGQGIGTPVVLGSGLLFALVLFGITVVAFTRNQRE